MVIEIKNKYKQIRAGGALVSAIGGERVSGIHQGYRGDLKNILGNLIVDGYAGCPRAEGYIALDASLATESQANDLYLAEVVSRGEHLEVFLRWYVILHTLTPNRVITRLVKQHNDVVPERYHVTLKINDRGCIELHHNEPLLRGYIDGDPCNVGLTTWVARIDPLHHFAEGDIPLHSIMSAYARLSPDWGGHHEYDTYLHEYDARRMAGWPDDYWCAGALAPQHYKDLFDAYRADAIRRRLVRKFGRRVKPLTYRR